MLESITYGGEYDICVGDRVYVLVRMTCVGEYDMCW